MMILNSQRFINVLNLRHYIFFQMQTPPYLTQWMIWLQRKGPVSQYDQTESDSFGSMESNIHPKRIIINQPDWKIVISQGNDDCIHHNILSFWGSLPLPELPFQPLVPPRTAQLSRLLNSASNWSLNYPQMFVPSSISLRKNGWNIFEPCSNAGYLVMTMITKRLLKCADTTSVKF